MALRLPNYTPNFSYEKTIVKFEDAIKRKDLKAFKSLFLRFVVNLKEDVSKKKTEAIQNAYKTLDSYFAFFKAEIMSTFTLYEAHQNAKKLMMIGDIHQKFNNSRAITFSLEILHFCMSKRTISDEFYDMVGQTFKDMFVDCQWRQVIEEADKVIHFLSEFNLPKEKIHVRCLYFKAEAAFKLDDYEKSLKFSRKLLKAYQTIPTDIGYLSDCYYRIADCHYNLGNSKMALKIMNEKVIPITTQWKQLERGDLLEQHCDALYNIGRFSTELKECFKGYQALIEFLHHDSELYPKLSSNPKTMMMEIQARKFIESYIEHGDNIVMVSDGKSEGDFNIARQLYQNGDYYGALEALDKCVHVPQITMSQVCFLELKGDCLFAIEKYGDAADNFKKALQANENEIVPLPLCELYQKLGLCHYRMGYWPESLDANQRALQSANIPDYYKCKIRVEMSMSLLDLRKYQQALDVLKEAQNIIGSNGIDFANLQILVFGFSGQALFHLGNFKAAMAYLDRALKLTEMIEVKVLWMIYFINCLRNLNEEQVKISENFTYAFDVNATVFKKKSSWHRGVLLLNQCIFHKEQKNKIAQNKALDLLLKPKNLKLVTKALINTPQESDIKPFFRLMKKRDNSEELENYNNSICILNFVQNKIH